MTANFALSLSFDGIKLMHRVPGGWYLVSEVALDCADLGGELAQLRAKAQALEPSGLRTKILLPNEQIKYLAIDTTQTSLEDIQGALQGATPYPLDALVIDFNRSGGRTHIAAVARETLHEAEVFAAQHKFAPVAFAAVAEPFTFRTEVFFGMTRGAADILGHGVEVTRDEEPVKVIGAETMPQPPLQDATDVPGWLNGPAQADAAQPVEIAQLAASAAADAPDVVDDVAPEESAFEEPVLSFARSAGRVPPKDIGAPAPISTPAAPAPVVTPAPAAPASTLPEIEEPVFASRKNTKPEVATPPAQVEADPITAEADAPAIPQPMIIDTPAPHAARVAPVAAPMRASEPAPEKQGVMARLLGRGADAPPAQEAAIGPIGGRGDAAVGGKPRYLGLMLTAGLLIFLAIIAAWASTLDDDGLAGLFGFGSDAGIQTAAAPAADLTTASAAPQTAAPQIAAPQTAAPQTAAPSATITQDVPAQVRPTPIVTAVPGRVLSPAEADRIYAATGVWQRAPRLPEVQTGETLDGLTTYATLPRVAPIAQPRPLAASAQSVDTAFLRPPNPAPAGTIVQRDENGFIQAAANGTIMPNGVWVYARAPRIIPPTRPAAAALDAAVTASEAVITNDDAPDGVLLIAGRPDVLPPERPEELVIPEAEVTAQEPTPEDALTEDVATDTAAADADAPADDATAEDALAEDALAEDADAVTPGAVALAAFRPSVRPSGLVPEAPFADPALAGLRPSLRPEDLAPPPADEDAIDAALAEAETPEDAPEETPAETAANTDIASVIATIAAAAPPSQLINPTARAIVASPRPDTRPTNFARVVSSAQQAAARQQSAAASTQAPSTQAAAPQAAAPAAAAVSSAAAAPTGPVPQSVASAATMDGAINLRNVNLIGVYGRPNDRRALIRLANGRYVKVEVGSAFEGGQITVIGDDALNYVVRGQLYSLQLPQG